jgi:hypothetical protein
MQTFQVFKTWKVPKHFVLKPAVCEAQDEGRTG